MTLQEARQQVDACERQITGAYSNLRDAARSMGSNTAQAQSHSTNMKAVRLLIISLIGLFLCFVSHPVWGILLIIAGVFFAFVRWAEGKTIDLRDLNNILDSNSKI